MSPEISAKIENIFLENILVQYDFARTNCCVESLFIGRETLINKNYLILCNFQLMSSKSPRSSLSCFFNAMQTKNLLPSKTCNLTRAVLTSQIFVKDNLINIEYTNHLHNCEIKL